MTESLITKEEQRLFDRFLKISESNMHLQIENQKLLQSVDWKLWEILKIAKSFATEMNIEIKDHFDPKDPDTFNEFE